MVSFSNQRMVLIWEEGHIVLAYVALSAAYATLHLCKPSIYLKFYLDSLRRYFTKFGEVKHAEVKFVS